jgi:hypothetical protein
MCLVGERMLYKRKRRKINEILNKGMMIGVNK